ncbi:hypothetical protein [Corynebacterium propinquum]
MLDLVWHREIQSLGPVFQPTQVSMLRRVAEIAGPWTDSKAGLEDWDLWVRIASVGYTFYVVGESSVQITRTRSSRSYQLPIKWQVPLGHAQTRKQMETLITSMQSPKVRAEAEQITLNKAASWYRTLWDEGLTVSVNADGVPQLSDVIQLVQMVQAQPVPFPWPPLRAVPRPDGSFDVGMDLLTVNRHHSSLAVETLYRRFPRKLALVRSPMKKADFELVE